MVATFTAVTVCLVVVTWLICESPRILWWIVQETREQETVRRRKDDHASN